MVMVTSLIQISLVTAIVQAMIGSPITGLNFSLLVVTCAFVGFVFLYVQILRGVEVEFPDRLAPTLLLTALVIWMVAAVLAPKFYWENFNGDGAHAFEASRLLLFQPFPFWSSAAGNVATFPGISSMLFAYPSSWFIRLFGEHEVSGRLPYLLFLVGAFGGIQALIESGQDRVLHLVQQSLIWLALTAYTLTVAYSATYSPYSADIALPATQDTLMMVCFLGFLLAFLNNERSWMVLFLLLTLFSLPNGLLLSGMWMVSVVVAFRPVPWRKLLFVMGGIIFFFALSFVTPPLMKLFNLPFSKDEYGLIYLLSRFAFLQFTDIRRVLYIIIPAGILPVVGLVLWGKQGPIERALTILTLIYFAFFYFQAYTALHYYIPIMLILPILFWRILLKSSVKIPQWLYGAIAITGILAVILSLPANFPIYLDAKAVGATIENRISGYDIHNPDVYRSLPLLSNLFPYDWDPSVPLNNYGGSALVWNYYSQHKDVQNAEINYVLQSVQDSPPVGMKLVASNSEFALYIRDKAVLARQRAIRPASPPSSPVYYVSRAYLFQSISDPNVAIINVIDVLRRIGIDLTPILHKFGIEVP